MPSIFLYYLTLTILCISLYHTAFQLDVTFKVEDENDRPLVGVKIEIESSETSETLQTNEEGEAKANNKHVAGTKFTVILTKEGYHLEPNGSGMCDSSGRCEIVVNERQSKNVFHFQKNIKSVSLTVDLERRSNKTTLNWGKILSTYSTESE